MIIKHIYNLIPFKKQLFSLLKLFYTPNDALLKHLHFKGVFKTKTSKSSSFKIMHHGNVIENELFWKGINNGWEKISLELWTTLCKDAKNIIDIGANTGIYSLVAKSINNNANVYAFEPVERVFDKLIYNNKLNNYNISCYQYALSNKNGKAVIYDIPEMEHIYSVTVNKDLTLPGTKTMKKEIKTKTLDTFIEENKIEKIDLIKIDVETHEPEVLEGYIKHIQKHRPTMLIEVLNDEIGGKIETLIQNLEYIYFNIDENHGLKKSKNIIQSDHYNYLICSVEKAQELNLI